VDRGQPVRVMDLRGTYKGGGGPDKTILLSAVKHDAERFFVLVTYLRDPRDSEFEIEERARNLGIDYIDVADSKLCDWGCIRELSRLLRKHRLQIVHAHDDKSSLYAFFLKLLNPGVKVMYTCHLYSMYQRADFHTLKSYLAFRVRKAARYFLLARSHRPILAVSEAVRQSLITEGLGDDEVETLYNGIDVRHWQRKNGNAVLRGELSLPEDAVLIGTVARIAYQKDLATFYRVAAAVKAKVPNAYFVIVGEGEGALLAEARREAQSHGVADYLFFTGHRNDLLDIYASFDLFLMTSVSEGLPNTVLEAMAMEVPVVSTAVDGVPELVEEGATGYLRPMKDVDGLAARVVELVTDQALRSAFAARGRQRILTLFSFDERVVKMERYYERFHQKPRRAGGVAAPLPAIGSSGQDVRQ
jgi:glycosyltransferase involved in cell wall biosynthesis